MKAESNRSTILHLQLALVLATTLFLGFSSIQAQESLRDMVREGGAEWMVGKWTGTNQEGQEVTVEYEWELDGHGLEVDLQMGRGAYKGMIVRQPTDGKVIEVGADNGGGTTRATWREEDGRLISERTGTRPGGEVGRIAVINQRIDADHIKATVHSLSVDGEIGKEPLDTVTLTRVAADAEKD